MELEQNQSLYPWHEGTRLDSIVNFRPLSLREPSAWLGHLPFAYWIVEKTNPRIFVELGTHTGASYFAFCQSILENKTSTKAFAVDTWVGDEHSGFYEESVFDSVYQANHKFKHFSTLLRTTFDNAVSSFEDNSVDLLHIDGYHTYEAVKHDFESWLPKLTDNAVVLFHDTNVHRDDFGVHKFWAEISIEYPSFEFFHYHGLGVIQLSEKENSFIPTNEFDLKVLRGFFSGLSDSMLVKFERDGLAAERDGLAAERDAVYRTKLWRWTRGIRLTISKLRN